MQQDEKPRRELKKIWIAMSTPFQANFFHPIIERLKDECEFLVTARDHDSILSILDAKHVDYTTVGRHGGRDLAGKLQAYAENIQHILPIVRHEKPDLLLTERWPEAVRVAFGLGVPAWTIFYDEREIHVNKMVFPLSAKVFAPDFYTAIELQHHGVSHAESVVWFKGFHTGYLKGEETNGEDPFDSLGADHPVVLVRPEPEFASFFPQSKPVLKRAIDLLTESRVTKLYDFSLVMMPRNEAQATRYREEKVMMMESSCPLNPVAHADVVMGAAETMLMEAFTLGNPAVSAIYWPESRPVTELHKYIRHETNPTQIRDAVVKYLDPEERLEFRERASLIVENMDNPVDKMVAEIQKIYNVGGEQKGRRPGRRSAMEVHMEVLQAMALRPVRITYIMKTANISHSHTKRIIGSLKENGLVEEHSTSSGKLFRATLDGLQALSTSKKLREALSI